MLGASQDNCSQQFIDPIFRSLSRPYKQNYALRNVLSAMFELGKAKSSLPSTFDRELAPIFQQSLIEMTFSNTVLVLSISGLGK
jgi:hypothetical protein